MAKISKDDVLRLAKLARLELSDEETTQFSEEISSILKYVEQLRQVDVSGLEPTYQVTGLKTVARPDVVKNYGASPEELLSNVPGKKGHFIKVKRMLQ